MNYYQAAENSQAWCPSDTAVYFRDTKNILTTLNYLKSCKILGEGFSDYSV